MIERAVMTLEQLWLGQISSRTVLNAPLDELVSIPLTASFAILPSLRFLLHLFCVASLWRSKIALMDLVASYCARASVPRLKWKWPNVSSKVLLLNLLPESEYNCLMSSSWNPQISRSNPYVDLASSPNSKRGSWQKIWSSHASR